LAWFEALQPSVSQSAFIKYRTCTRSTQEHTIKTEERKKNTEMYALMALLTKKNKNKK